MLNATDPWTEVDGERSSVKTKHPLFTDPAVRKAIGLLIDRASIEKFIYGRTGIATANFLNNPERVRSQNTNFEFNIEKATQMLEAAGWKKGAYGVRAKDGKPLKFVYQTSINAPRQKTQAIIKQACQKAGIDVELKSVVASVFFSSDTANPDTYPHFYCDVEMYKTTMPQPDPQLFMNQYASWEIATKDNKWQGRNICRWQSKEYDDTYHQAEQELDVPEAGGDVHQAQRHGDWRQLHPAGRRPLEGGRGQGRRDRAFQRLGQRPVAARQLVPGLVRPAPKSVTRKH